MSCYLNIKLSQFNPEGKFEFPGKNVNQSEKRIYVTIAHQLFSNFKLLRDFKILTLGLNFNSSISAS